MKYKYWFNSYDYKKDALFAKKICESRGLHVKLFPPQKENFMNADWTLLTKENYRKVFSWKERLLMFIGLDERVKK